MTVNTVPFCPDLKRQDGFLAFARDAQKGDLVSLRKYLDKQVPGPRSEEVLKELTAKSLLLDFLDQGWRIQVEGNMVALGPPASVLGDPLAEKARIRQAQLVERDKYLAKRPIKEFVTAMEQRRLTGKGWHSIYSLMRDGHELALKLRARGLTTGSDADPLVIKEVISPYLQVVEPGLVCEHTGLDLGDVWRYFRLTWVNAPKSVPGRSMMFLVRDAAAPHHPVIGISALGSSVVQQRLRDAWIGWDAETFVTALSENPTTKMGRWLLQSLESHVEALYIKDLVAQEVFARRLLRNPTKDCIETLQHEAKKSRERHNRNPQLDIHRQHEFDWSTRATTHLFRAKRCESLARLLAIRMVFQESGLTAGTKTEVVEACRNSEFLTAVGQLIRINKAEHVGINMMDITVCGALAPYSHLLGGKLVCALMCSPEVVKAYGKRYSQESIIASCMLGASVKREPRLVFLATTSLYGIGASQYNRIKIPLRAIGGESDGTIRYENLGLSQGYGSYHVSPETSRFMDELIGRRDGGGRKVNRLFGEGVNPRMRMIRQAMEVLNLPSDKLLRHGNTRVIYGVPLAHNFRDVLIGLSDRPSYFLPLIRAKEGTTALASFWMKRWLAPRLARPGILDDVAKHTLSYPVEHGARVAIVNDDFEGDSHPHLFES